jgi:hypothetical protein
VQKYSNVHIDVTLIHLSFHNPAYSSFQNDISDILQASLEAFDTVGDQYRTLSLWRWIGYMITPSDIDLLPGSACQYGLRPVICQIARSSYPSFVIP